MSGFVVVKLHREFPYPVERAFEWLTDYQDDDPQRTDAVVKRRPVLERRKDVVVLEGTIEILGRGGTGRTEVHLFPPDHYEARIVDGRGRGSVYEYRLSPTPHGCRLDVTYRLRIKRLKNRVLYTLYKPIIRRELHRMWDGFERSMKDDLAGA